MGRGRQLLLLLLGELALLGPLLAFSAPANDTTSWNGTHRIRTFASYHKDGAYEPIPLQDIDSDTESDSEVGSGLSSLTKANQTKAQTRFISHDAKRYLTSQWLTRFVPSVYTLVVMLSLPLNITAILVFLIKMKIKKPAIVYMLNLASADVLF